MSRDIIKVAAFTGGADVPSARFRVRQYVAMLARLGVSVDEMRCSLGKYPPQNTMLRPLWLLAALSEQALNVAKLGRYDVVLLQREMVSKLVTLERWVGRRMVLDVDDAIFLHRKGSTARRLAERAAVIVCGNSYLADNFSRWNPRVRVIPTGIDTDRYRPAEKTVSAAGEGGEVIGWMGTSSNLPELVAIEGALADVLARFPKAKLRVISDRPPPLSRIPATQLEFVAWTKESEVRLLQEMDIGIMPLQESPWTLGKCSFKMIQYMACGLPSVVSHVGMNAEIAQMAPCTLSVRNSDEWVEALGELLRNARLRSVIGRTAREVAEKSFGVKVLAPRLAEVLRDAAHM